MSEGIGLLQHTLSRFGVVTVMDAMLLDITTKEPLLELDTLKISNISTDGSSKEIRGGMTADLLLKYDHSRTANVEIQDALLSMHSLRQLWGGTLKEDNVAYHEKITFDVSADYSTGDIKVVFEGAAEQNVDLTKEKYSFLPLAQGGYFNAYNVTKGEKLQVSESAESGKVKEITLKGTFAVGDEIAVYGMNVCKSTDNNGFIPLEVALKSNSFPGSVVLVGKTVFLEQQTGKQVYAEIEIPKFNLGSNFSFSMDAEGDASTFDFSGVALVDSKTKELIKVKTIRYVDGVLG